MNQPLYSSTSAASGICRVFFFKKLMSQVILFSLYFRSAFASLSGATTVRSFQFEIDQVYAPLRSSLPHHTSIYNNYPRKDLRTELPDFLSIATTSSETSESSYLLMGKPIHVLQNEHFSLEIRNNLPSTGLSIHFHGFEMHHKVEYDGVVGLTQCPISPKSSFTYKFQVEEDPGTYWYHTHSGSLGINSHNYIKGPLIVHPNTPEHKKMVNRLNSLDFEEKMAFSDLRMVNYRSLLSYSNGISNERILFISDGFLASDETIELSQISGLRPPVQEDDDGFVAASMPFEFGTLNGKLREVIHVERGKKYIWRIINGGNHFGFRFSIDQIDSFKILKSDSTSVSYSKQDHHDWKEVNELILHNGERFDIELTIPDTFLHGTKLWMRIDTLEARSQGYQNGIRGILHIVDDVATAEKMHDDDISDPESNIEQGPLPVEERVTLNCYSEMEESSARLNGIGACLPINVLRTINYRNDNHMYRSLLRHEKKYGRETQSLGTRHVHSTVFRTVDFDVSPPPLHAHFVRIQHGNWYQNVGSKTHMLRPDFDAGRDLHPHTAIMNVPANSPVIIIWRSRSLMAHPMHLHGYKMEILETFTPKRSMDCTLVKCDLSEVFDSSQKMHELEKIPIGSYPFKDTFVMPAGGAVATRIITRDPAPWLAHCHMEAHKEDGMAFILNVGNYVAPRNDTWLPNDFPSCETTFWKSQANEKAQCNCYIDEDAVLGLALDSTYKCSRKYLCIHEHSQVAALTRDKSLGGFKIQSSSSIPGWVTSSIILAMIAIVTLLLTVVMHQIIIPGKPELVRAFSEKVARISMMSVVHLEMRPSFWEQFKGLVFSQWTEYRPGSVNILRVVEVAGLGIITGILFQDVGINATAAGFREKNSLLFFSTTLFSQTRMYPAIGNYFEWCRKDYLTFKHKQYDLLPVCLSRMVVVNACEGWWPFLFVLCAYPLAAMFGDIGTVFKIGFLLAMNNLCYIALGGVFGTLLPTVSLGMIAATLFAQTTVICAGFFTKLPGAFSWIRYISPIFYTFKGIVKSAYRWDDTYTCPSGNSAVGTNDCYLEESAMIDDYKQRGINVATFGDPSSNKVYMEIAMLIVLFTLFQIIMILYHYLVQIWSFNGRDTVILQEEHDDQYDEGMMDLGRQSLFLRVDNKVSTVRQSMRASVRPSPTRNYGTSYPNSSSDHQSCSANGLDSSITALSSIIRSRCSESRVPQKPGTNGDTVQHKKRVSFQDLSRVQNMYSSFGPNSVGRLSEKSLEDFLPCSFDDRANQSTQSNDILQQENFDHSTNLKAPLSERDNTNLPFHIETIVERNSETSDSYDGTGDSLMENSSHNGPV